MLKIVSFKNDNANIPESYQRCTVKTLRPGNLFDCRMSAFVGTICKFRTALVFVPFDTLTSARRFPISIYSRNIVHVNYNRALNLVSLVELPRRARNSITYALCR